MIDVLFLLLPGSLILDWAGPAEALRIANGLMRKQGKAAPFALRFCAPQPESITSVGVQLAGLEALPASLATHASWVVLAGQAGTHIGTDSPDTRALLEWLRPLQLTPGRLELVTICAGAVLAAHAGLLARRRAAPRPITTTSMNCKARRRLVKWCAIACSWRTALSTAAQA